MAQADSITTATREGVSRGVSITSTSLRLAHTERAASLAANAIQPIYLDFQSKDLDSRNDRLDKAFEALHFYVTAFVSDAAQQIPSCSLDTVIRNAPEELRDHENWKVS